MTTPKRSPAKRSSLASSASQSRRSVHFDDETLVSRPETINSSLKKRVIAASYPPYNNSSWESRYDDCESSHERLSIMLSPRKPSDAASWPKIDGDANTPMKDDFLRSRRRHSIVLSPTKHPVVSSRPNIDPTRPMNDDDSPRRGRRRSIVLPLTTTSLAVPPNIHGESSKSPRKRRFSTLSPPFNDSIHDDTPNSPCKRQNFSPEDRIQPDPSFFPRTRKLCIIPPSTNKPPPHVCSEINQRIRSTFHYPDFDFIQHVQHRSYVVRTQYFKESECVTMLDTSVDDLLQRKFEKLPPQPNTSMNIDIRPSPGKGLGMFSRRQISNGEAFFVEYPTVITPYVIGLSTGLSALYADIFGKLSGPVFGELMDLSSSYSISGETRDVHEAIMRINALAIELPVPMGEFSELNTHRALFLQTSRCNHSCGPNAKWEWDLKRFSLVLTAVRPINEGEEITIPYIATNMTTKERQDILSRFYRFKCLCSLCVVPSDNIQSDIARISTYTETKQKTKANSETTFPSSLLPSFEKWCLDPTFPDDILINAHMRTLQLTKQDDHRPPRDMDIKHLDAIAMCYGALEDVDNFRKWIERVSEARSRVKPEQKPIFSKWLSNPTSFPVWGWRRAFCGEEGDASSVQDSDSELSSCVSMGMFDSI